MESRTKEWKTYEEYCDSKVKDSWVGISKRPIRELTTGLQNEFSDSKHCLLTIVMINAIHMRALNPPNT
jgi:hypothetical protein